MKKKHYLKFYLLCLYCICQHFLVFRQEILLTAAALEMLLFSEIKLVVSG